MDDSDISGLLSSSSSDVEAKNELQETLMLLKQKALFDAHIRNYTSTCWDMCVNKPGSKLDYSTETCLNNCVERLLDASLFIRNRFAQSFRKISTGL